MRIYVSDATTQRYTNGSHSSLDRLVILTGTALHRLDDAVTTASSTSSVDGDGSYVNNGGGGGDDFFNSAFPHRRYIPLYRQYYMAAVVTSVFTTGRLWNAPPDFYHRPSDWATAAYLFGRWLELMLFLDLLPIQSCRATGHCPRHCALAATGYADFRRTDCDHPDVFFAWTFLVVSATLLLLAILLAQCLTHSYTVWKDAIVRARAEWKLVDSITFSSFWSKLTSMTTASWKDMLQWEVFVEKDRYHRGERFSIWWGRLRTYECVKATTRPPPYFIIDDNVGGDRIGLVATTPLVEWLVPLAQWQWLLGALYLLVWLVRFFFFGIYSAWVYGLYAAVAHCLAAYAITYPPPPIKQLAQEVNDRPKTYRL